MRICPRSCIVISHRLGREQAAGMNLLCIMTAVPGPNVRCPEHGCSPIIACPLIYRWLPIVLTLRLAQGIGLKVSGVPGDVVTVLMIEDPRVVRSVRSVAST